MSRVRVLVADDHNLVRQGLVSLLVVDTIITSMQPQHLGTLYRTFRLAEFVIALWLLTPWWGRRDMLLLRCHLRWLYVALGSVLLGLLVAPGRAFSFDGRLTGVIWPMLPTQIAQYAAIAAGLTVVLWLVRLLSGRVTLVGVTVDVFILLLTHTRTALVGPEGSLGEGPVHFVGIDIGKRSHEAVVLDEAGEQQGMPLLFANTRDDA